MLIPHLEKLGLNSRDEAYLVSKSAISKKIIQRSMIFSGDWKYLYKNMGLSSGGIVFPYFNLQGEFIGCRVRLDEPMNEHSGKSIRYFQEKGSSITCYFIPDDRLRLLDGKTAICVTEGERKLLSIASLQELEKMTFASYPGCNNFTEKGSGKLSKEWSDIPFANRTVIWIPDTDYFTNLKVRRAGDKFLKLLLKAGASVSVVYLMNHNNLNKKYGADDFIVEFGKDAFLKRCKTPVWTFSLSVSTDLKTSCRNLAHLTLSEFGKHADKLAELFKEELPKVFRIWKAYRLEWNHIRGDHDVDPEYVEIEVGDEVPRQEIIKQVSGLLKGDGRFYRYGTEILMIKEEERELIDAVSLPGRLNSLGIEFVKRWRGSSRYELLSVPLARALLQSSHVMTGFPEIALFTNHPTYDKEWQISPPGYHSYEQTYYSGEDIAPLKSRACLEYLLKDFLFKNEASRCNFVGLLLTAILRNKYRGNRPFGALTGNRPGIGKSLAGKIIAIIAEGTFPESITYSRNQEEFEKQISARLVQRDVVFVDNVKSSHPVDSPVLERLITDDPISFRKLGYSQTITRPNTSIVLMTMNQATFCQDLISRLLPIEFYLDDEQEISHKKFTTDSLHEYVKAKRIQILQELCGMIETWKEMGMPSAKRDFRFRQWAKEIGGILECNGFGAFLTNLCTAQSEYSKDTSGLGILFRNCLGRATLVEELLKICQAENLFPEILDARGPAISLANLLARHIGKTITLPDGKYFVLKNGPMDRRRKVKTYVAALIGEASDSAGIAGTETGPPPQVFGQQQFCHFENPSEKLSNIPVVPAESDKPSVSECISRRGYEQGDCGESDPIGLSPQNENIEVKGNDLSW